jgi:hypothetical protein
MVRAETTKKLPIDLCVDWCTGGLSSQLNFTLEEQDTGPMAIVFDPGERALDRIDSLWEGRNKYAPLFSAYAQLGR